MKVEEYLSGVKIEDKDSYKKLISDFQDYNEEEIVDIVKGFITTTRTIDEACEYARLSLIYCEAGKII